MKGGNGSASGGRYLRRIDDTLFDSVAFRTLPGSAMKLWIDMRTKFRGNNNGHLPITLAKLRERGWNSQQKLHAAAQELVRRGLLKFTRRCGPNTFHRASLYAITDIDVARSDALGIAGAEAGHEYLKWLPGMSFDPRDAEPDAAANPVFRVVPIRDGNGSRIGTATAPETGQRTAKTAPETGQRQKARRTRRGADFQ